MFPESLQRSRGQGRGAGNKQPHEAANLLGEGPRQLQQLLVHRWHAEENRRAEAEKLFPDGLLAKPLQQPHPVAGRQPGVQAVAQPVDMKQGQRKQQPIFLRHPPGGD